MDGSVYTLLKNFLQVEHIVWAQIWSGLYIITVEILRVLTIKLTQARARTMARTRAMARDWAMVRTTDRPRLRARAMVSSRARAMAWKCVYV